MSFIYIDARERGFVVLGLLDAESSKLKRLHVPLGGLVKVLQKYFTKSALESAQGIIVINGPGPFSSIRTGVLAANLLSRILRIPLYAVSGSGKIDISTLLRDVASGHIKPVKYAEPIYDAEPNITISKSI